MYSLTHEGITYIYSMKKNLETAVTSKYESQLMANADVAYQYIDGKTLIHKCRYSVSDMVKVYLSSLVEEQNDNKAASS